MRCAQRQWDKKSPKGKPSGFFIGIYSPPLPLSGEGIRKGASSYFYRLYPDGVDGSVQQRSEGLFYALVILCITGVILNASWS